ncbi:NAD-dependent epimerase/dehydratase family protein [Nocardiopsis sp. CNT-189]|uniref:NAD-dependent epimerase/dehydratase family protein n=1 Tax=Nocardiopsis oceanisediminis TaxID=2816862 RepID=UPI003B3AE37C
MTDPRPLVAVLGASGFIGSWVADELSRRPVRLRLVARGPVPEPAGGAARVEVRSADLTAGGELARAVEGADAVVHLAARLGGATGWRAAGGDGGAERVNVGLMHDLIGAVRDRGPAGPPPAVVFAGTTTQVGLADRTRLDGTEPDRPRSTYDRHKLAAEQALKEATAAGAVRGASLRLPTVFGQARHPGTRDRGVVSSMARRALGGDALTMWNDGTVLRDLVHVRDAARALVAALDHADALAGGHWLVGSGSGARLGDVFSGIARLVSERVGRPPVPVLSVEPPGQAEETDFRSVEIDPSRFRDATGWRPEIPLEEGLRQTVAALADQAEREEQEKRAERTEPGPAPRG